MRYFVATDGQEREVSKKEYIRVEREAGFLSRFGPDEIATSAFQGSSGISGRVDYETREPQGSVDIRTGPKTPQKNSERRSEIGAAS